MKIYKTLLMLFVVLVATNLHADTLRNVPSQIPVALQNEQIADSIMLGDTSHVSNSQPDTLSRSQNLSTLPLPEIEEIHFRKKKENRWLFFISCAIFLLIGFNRVLNIKRYDKLFYGSLQGMPFKSNEAVYKEISIHQIIAMIIIAFIGGFALILWLPLPFEEVFTSSLGKYFFFVVIFLIIYSFKAFFYHLVITILQIKETPNLLFSQFIMITYALAILTLPLMIIRQYSPFEEINRYLEWFCILLAFLFFILRLFRATQALASVFPYSILYLFLYLCSLEIIPWVFMIQGLRFWVLK